jgi:hypothetical protein
MKEPVTVTPQELASEAFRDAKKATYVSSPNADGRSGASIKVTEAEHVVN